MQQGIDLEALVAFHNCPGIDQKVVLAVVSEFLNVQGNPESALFQSIL
jgi:hypothetical protein